MGDKKRICQLKDNVGVFSLAGSRKPEDGILGLFYQVLDLYEEAASNAEIRAVVVTDADEDAFWPERSRSRRGSEAPETSFSANHSPADVISRLDRPVIAAVQGDAMGLGLELLLACDIRVAAETSHFGLPQIKDGLIPWDGGTQRLSRLVGRGKALEMILLGSPIDAREAYRIGLVNRVAPRPAVQEEAEKMAKEMASKGPVALSYIKEAINKGMDMTLEQGLRLEADLYLLIHTTKDRTEGVRAFQEKRKAGFRGE